MRVDELCVETPFSVFLTFVLFSSFLNFILCIPLAPKKQLLSEQDVFLGNSFCAIDAVVTLKHQCGEN